MVGLYHKCILCFKAPRPVIGQAFTPGETANRVLHNNVRMVHGGDPGSGGCLRRFVPARRSPAARLTALPPASWCRVIRQRKRERGEGVSCITCRALTAAFMNRTDSRSHCPFVVPISGFGTAVDGLITCASSVREKLNRVIMATRNGSGPQNSRPFGLSRPKKSVGISDLRMLHNCCELIGRAVTFPLLGREIVKAQLLVKAQHLMAKVSDVHAILVTLHPFLATLLPNYSIFLLL